MSYSTFFKKKVSRVSNKDKFYSIPIDYFTGRDLVDLASEFSILIVNTPCNGFGDIVFGMKLYMYLKDFYPNCKVHIATTQPDAFIKFGVPSDDVIGLRGKRGVQCRRLASLKPYNPVTGRETALDIYDIIYVAPLTIDFEINYTDVKRLIPYSNRFNTFFFSEYNDSKYKKFDFPTGIGSKRMGLLFTDTPAGLERLDILPNPYTIAYVTKTDENLAKCLLAFIKMVTTIQKHNTFDIVMPDAVISELLDLVDKEDVRDNLNKHYTDLEIHTKNKPVQYYIASHRKSKKVLRIRADILPVEYKRMMNIYLYSTSPVLITGDQSITDVLSCCYKNITPYYQIMPWKSDFAKALSKELPQKYLSSIKTSCGTLDGIKYHPNMSKFIKRNDFRINARPKLDAIASFAISLKKKDQFGEYLRNFVDAVTTGRKVESIRQKIN